MHLNKFLKQEIRPYYLKLINIKPLHDFVHRSIYSAKFSVWSKNHKCKRFFGDYTARYDMYDFIVQTEKLESAIDYLEFGVYQGESIKWWLKRNKHPASKFIGFDSFLGLPKDWNDLKPKNTFSTNGRPPS